MTLSPESPSHLKIGTCAWAHEDWREAFYPPHLPPEERLGFYARHLPGVEVDSTFYGIPTPRTVAHWDGITPDGFAFACKLPQEITHQRRLRDSSELLREFLAALAPLGEKLWCVVAQFPPSFQLRRDEGALRAFMRHLPAGVRFAFEFRHAEWHQPRIAHLLEEHQATWVWSDLTSLDHQQEGAFEFLPDTSDLVYVRLMGDLEQKYRQDQPRYRQVLWPRDIALDNWAARLRQSAAAHRRIFVAVNNHFEGYAPATAQRLGERLGLSLALPARDPSGQAASMDDPQLKLL